MSTPAAVGRLPARALRNGVVPRDRLVSRLLGATDALMALVVAPAGYGKTTVLSEWDDADERRFAWLPLEERHSEPLMLFGAIARALDELEPIDEGVFAALSIPRPNVEGVVVPRLCESLDSRDAPFVLVLDDFHLVRSSESVDQVVRLAEHLPEGSMVALASRNEPPIRHARLRAHHLLVELEASDLVMTRSEGTRLLEGAGLRLHPDASARLVGRTEGWPAALYLAALSLRGADDPDEAVREFAGDDRIVADYLHEELISGLSPDRLDFLLGTSVLDRPSGPLCDAVLEREGSAEILRQMSRSNLLVVPLDRRGRQYRYHALMREMLQSELRRAQPGRERELHLRASAWYAAHADFERAVPHAIASGDIERAGDLIWGRTARYASDGLEPTLERWLGAFTEEQIASTPTLSLARATCRLSQGHGPEIERWVATALRVLDGSRRDDREALEVAATVIRASGAATEGIDRMRGDVVGSYALLPDDSPWRSICRLIEGTALYLAGHREHAGTVLEDGARRGAATAPHVETLCLAQLVLLALDDDDLDSAALLADRSLAAAEHHGLNEYPTSALLFAAAALVRARRGHSADATRNVKRSAEALAALTDFAPWYEAEVRIVGARALVLLDDVAGAREQLSRAARFVNKVPDAPVLREWLERTWQEVDPVTTSDHWPLTPAELRLLHFMPTHLSFREIAEQLVVSTNTVKTQAQAVYRKLGVSSRAEAVACAQAAGLIEAREVPKRTTA
jgi:LuxR family transcriptional regulator, maltose regulon positive regulatory protein